MATEYLFANNATTTLAQSISATSTVLNVASGEGSLFPSPASGQAFAVTLVDAATGLTNEICYCTSRSGDQLTVSRGQEGTNATTWAAGDTCANYITAGTIENWLQESDLNGYATQSWSNSAFVKNNKGNSGGIVSADMDAIGVPSFLSGNGVWYPVQLHGDYATNAALSTEASSRSSADANLQNQVNNRVVKTGDTMTGGLTIKGNTGGFIADYTPTSANNGDYINYPGIISSSSGRGAQFHVQLQEHVGDTISGLFSLGGSDGTWRYMSIPKDGRINDSSYGDVAYTADLSSYVPTSTYVSDFGTSDSRVINLPYGHRIQAFTVAVDGNGSNSHRITYPQSFSGNSTATFNCNNTGQSRSVSLANGTQPDSTGFNISVSVHGNSTGPSTDGLTLTVIAIGPK